MYEPSAFATVHRDWLICTRPYSAVWVCRLSVSCIVHFGWSIHVSPLLCSFDVFPQFLQRSLSLVGLRVTFALERCLSQFFALFRVETRDSCMLHTTSIVSWIALAFVGLWESSEFVSWATATDRAETCEVLEDRLHEVETELKELREEPY